MDTTPKTVAMEDAAWLVSFIVSKPREKFIEVGLKNIHVFPGKTDQQRAEMLGQVWDIANKMINGNSLRTAKKPKKR